MPKTFNITVDDAFLMGVTAARLVHNKSLPQTVTQTADDGTTSEVPNPDLFATDDAYVQARWGVDAATSYYNSNQAAFRIPTGDWLQRWTADEKKKIREIGAGLVTGVDATTAATVQGFLDRLDVSPIVNLTDTDVVNGVPMVCSVLESLGVIATGTSADRVAAINALNI